MDKSGGSSRDCLWRAQELRRTGDANNLYYAALEIRFGIEARLCEYLNAPGDTLSLRQMPWQIRRLKKCMDEKHGVINRPIAVTFFDPDTSSPVVCEYTPVTEKLKKIGEKLGEFLHLNPRSPYNGTETKVRLAALIEAGIDELTTATRGTFLRPPDGGGRFNSLRLVWEQGAMPAFVRTNASGTLRLKFELISKSGNKAVLKIC